MSIEYFCELGQARASDVIRTVCAELTGDSSYIVTDCTNNALRGRFVGGSEYEEWPEDFVMTLADGEAYLAVHTGSREQRLSLVGKLSECLKLVGSKGQFDEQ